MENIIENLNKLEDLIINESSITLAELQYLIPYLTNIRDAALTPTAVSCQREQLIAFFNWYQDDQKELSNNITIIDAYMEAINCN